MKILVFGLPGSGKSYLSERLALHLNSAWYNADIIRKSANDWDFTPNGRHRQLQRMLTLANFEISHNRTVICDFVCPLESLRQSFNADISIWLNTIDRGRFEDTNAIFEKPTSVTFQITTHISDPEIEEIANKIKGNKHV